MSKRERISASAKYKETKQKLKEAQSQLEKSWKHLWITTFSLNDLDSGIYEIFGKEIELFKAINNFHELSEIDNDKQWENIKIKHKERNKLAKTLAKKNWKLGLVLSPDGPLYHYHPAINRKYTDWNDFKEFHFQYDLPAYFLRVKKRDMFFRNFQLEKELRRDRKNKKRKLK